MTRASAWKDEMTNEIFMSLQDEGDVTIQEVLDEGLDLVSQLDPKNMKVAELRAELEARSLSSKGD
jgi:hypothetical protein